MPSGRRLKWPDPGIRWAAVAAVLLATGLTVWLLQRPPPGIPGADRTRQYLDIRACLLTGANGVATAQAAAAWAGMQDVSRATRAMVSYQPVAGAASEAAALPYLASLAQRQCRVIAAVGAAPAAAATADAPRFRQIRFVVVAGRESRGNVTRVAPGPAAQVRTEVSAAVSAALQHGGSQ